MCHSVAPASGLPERDPAPLRLIGCVAVLLCATGPAIAAETPTQTAQQDDRQDAVASRLSPERSRGYIVLRYGRAAVTDDELAGGIELLDDVGAEALSASAGYNISKYVGIELAADYYEGNIGTPDDRKIGELTVLDIMPQVRLRYPLLNDRLTPYLVAGIGIGFSEFSDQTAFGASPGVPRFGAKDFSLAYAFGAGLEYFLADNIALGVEAKYIAHDTELEINGVPTETGVDAVLVTAGLRLLYPGPPKIASALAGTSPWWAYDPEEFRPYFGFRLGVPVILEEQITPAFVLSGNERSQVNGLMLGVNLNRYLGMELAVDDYGSDVEAVGFGKVKEYTILSFVPQLRVRYPLMGDSLVPYLLGGVGVSFTEGHDSTPLSASSMVPVFNARDFSPVGAFGGGAEYFFADNMALGIESKYLLREPEVEIDGVGINHNLDSVLFTVGLRVFYP